MISDHHRLDALDALGIEVVLICIPDTRTGTDPDTMSDIEAVFRAQMAAVQESLSADANPRTGKRKNDDRAEIRTKPGIRTDLDVRPLRNRDVNSVGPPLGVDTGPYVEPRTGGECEMGRSKVGARLFGE